MKADSLWLVHSNAHVQNQISMSLLELLRRSSLILLAGIFVLTRSPDANASLRIGTREYMSIQEWSKASGCEVRWLKRDESVQLGNDTCKIVLNVNSCEASVNGTTMWLSFPIVGRSG